MSKSFKLINAINTYKSIDVLSIPYGICDVASEIAEKIVNINNFTLEEGISIRVKFLFANTAESPTLTIKYQDIEDSNNWVSSRAVPIKGSVSWQAGDIVTFTYDGTNWVGSFGGGGSSGGKEPYSTTITSQNWLQGSNPTRIYYKIPESIHKQGLNPIIRTFISNSGNDYPDASTSALEEVYTTHLTEPNGDVVLYVDYRMDLFVIINSNGGGSPLM